MAKHSRYEGEIPDKIIVKRNRYDFIGVKCEFVKEKGDYAYYLNPEGTCSIVEWLNVKNINEVIGKTIFTDRKSLAEATLKDIEKLKNRCEDYLNTQDKDGWDF